MNRINSTVVFVLMFFAACQDLGGPEPGVLPDCNPPAQVDPSIVIGESIARIRIGDTRCDVVRKVGEPTRIVDGDFLGQIYYYEEPPLKYMFVSISDDPALGLGVIGVDIAGTFGGVTSDGIGIGSQRDFVLSTLGAPDTTEGQPPLLFDLYYFSSGTFAFACENQRVLRISMATPRRFF